MGDEGNIDRSCSDIYKSYSLKNAILLYNRRIKNAILQKNKKMKNAILYGGRLCLKEKSMKS